MVRLAGLLIVLLCFLVELMPTVTAMPLFEMCGIDANWLCQKKNVDMVPVEVIEICEACGNYWGNMPGFAFCCRCSQHVFGFCYEAVIGGK